jgi:hypothetical protein
MSSHLGRDKSRMNPKEPIKQRDDVQVVLSQLPPEMVREISSFCDVKAQFRYNSPAAYNFDHLEPLYI